MESMIIDKEQDPLDGWLSGPARTPGRHRVISLSLLSNAVALFIKGSVGILCGSQALVADAVHTLSDVFGFGVNYVGSRTTSPGSDTVPLIQGILIGTIVFLSGVWILADNTVLLLTDDPMHPGLLGLVVAGVSILVNGYLFACARRASRESSDSNIFICSVQNETNLFASCLVFMGMLLADLGLVVCDPICALLVGCLLFKASYEVFQHTFSGQSSLALSHKRYVLAAVGALGCCILGFFIRGSVMGAEVILVPAQGASMASPVDSVLGRADYFLILNADKSVTTVSNGARYIAGDVSDNLIGTVRVNKVTAVLASKIGAEMFTDLRSAGVKMYYIDRPGTVEQIISNYRNGTFQRARTSNVAKGYGRDTIRWLRPW